MTEETAEIPRLDYSKPPPGYTVRFEDSSGANGDGPPLWWYGAPHYLASMGSETEALAAAWAHHKAHNDPPGIDTLKALCASNLDNPRPRAVGTSPLTARREVPDDPA